MRGFPYLVWTLAGILLIAATGLPLHWATGLAPVGCHVVATGFNSLLLDRIDRWLSPQVSAPRIPGALPEPAALVGGSGGAVARRNRDLL
jgi:hypothetical protein